MFKSVSWFFAAAFFTLLVGPLTLFAAQAGEGDSADLYIIVGGGWLSIPQDRLLSYGASVIGPFRGRVSEMVHAPPSAREKLLQAGYIMLPAGHLAAICGIDTDSTDLMGKS